MNEGTATSISYYRLGGHFQVAHGGGLIGTWCANSPPSLDTIQCEVQNTPTGQKKEGKRNGRDGDTSL